LFDDRYVSLELARSVLETCLEGREAGSGLWIVQSLDGSARLGCAGLNPTAAVAAAEPRLAGLLEPVVALHPSRWNQGYAGEALASLLTHAFDTLERERIAGAADVPNTASIRMLERLGFAPLSEVQGPRYLMRTYLLTKKQWRSRRAGVKEGT
jgi:RimJ/RimL family protein N-acetyltransferase